MTDQRLRIDSAYGQLAAQFDPSAVGHDARGRRTAGALVQVWLPGFAPRSVRQSRALVAGAGEVRERFESWLAGDCDALDSIGVVYNGSEFRQRVLRQMRRVKSGHVVTYGELADAAGYPNSARAAGTVCATNRIPLVIPCHRVVRAGGLIGQYAGRPELKLALLNLEGWSGAANAR